MRHVVVGTAGHIDHGKSSLVLALTGTDPDRLKEEKLRGITVDLGFAHLERGGITYAFVDVPGHERFVRNMLAGAAGFDVVLLAVAADESVMPQTREHIEICRLLGVRNAVVALTRTDLVDDPDLIELAGLEVRELLEGSAMAEAPVLPVSSRTGAGLDRLRTALAAAAAGAPPREDSRPFRLPVDRAFTMRGFGAVVTGTLVPGGRPSAPRSRSSPAGSAPGSAASKCTGPGSGRRAPDSGWRSTSPEAAGCGSSGERCSRPRGRSAPAGCSTRGWKCSTGRRPPSGTRTGSTSTSAPPPRSRASAFSVAGTACPRGTPISSSSGSKRPSPRCAATATSSGATRR